MFVYVLIVLNVAIISVAFHNGSILNWMQQLNVFYSLPPTLNCPAAIPLNSFGMPKPTLYIITPTKQRNEQRADLTRLGQTLRLMPNLFWIVIEDNSNTSKELTNLLERSCVHYTHLAAKSGTLPRMGHVRGGIQRNRGMQWLRETHNLQPNLEGVMYFADDDNTYDVRLFDNMRGIKGVGVWAVGLVGGSMVETPKVRNNTVIGWDTAYAPQRSFATDMAGFAVNLKLLWVNPTARFHDKCRAGQIEPCFLEQLAIKRENLEPLGFDQEPGSRSILVWHTRTKGSGSKGGNKGFIVT